MLPLRRNSALRIVPQLVVPLVQSLIAAADCSLPSHSRRPYQNHVIYLSHKFQE
jgi:hypothetical protein